MFCQEFVRYFGLILVVAIELSTGDLGSPQKCHFRNFDSLNMETILWRIDAGMNFFELVSFQIETFRLKLLLQNQSCSLLKGVLNIGKSTKINVQRFAHNKHGTKIVRVGKSLETILLEIQLFFRK